MIKLIFHMISGTVITVEGDLSKSIKELENELIDEIKEKKVVKMCNTLINMKYVESIEIIQ
jgi:hypothetical protein